MGDEKARPKKSQGKKFIETARKIGCDESKALFERKLSRIAKVAPKTVKKAGKNES
jgi:hypothetical protein